MLNHVIDNWIGKEYVQNLWQSYGVEIDFNKK